MQMFHILYANYVLSFTRQITAQTSSLKKSTNQWNLDLDFLFSLVLIKWNPMFVDAQQLLLLNCLVKKWWKGNSQPHQSSLSTLHISLYSFFQNALFTQNCRHFSISKWLKCTCLRLQSAPVPAAYILTWYQYIPSLIFHLLWLLVHEIPAHLNYLGLYKSPWQSLNRTFWQPLGPKPKCKTDNRMHLFSGLLK